MWFKLSKTLKTERVFRRCQSTQYKRDNEKYCRSFLLIEIFIESLSGSYWTSAEELSEFLEFPLKQAEIVWNICIEELVLRKNAFGGYSATDWIQEKGWIGKFQANAAQNANFTPSRNSFF